MERKKILAQQPKKGRGKKKANEEFILFLFFSGNL